MIDSLLYVSLLIMLYNCLYVVLPYMYIIHMYSHPFFYSFMDGWTITVTAPIDDDLLFSTEIPVDMRSVNLYCWLCTFGYSYFTCIALLTPQLFKINYLIVFSLILHGIVVM